MYSVFLFVFFGKTTLLSTECTVFYSSQPHFDACQELHMALPWLTSIASVEYMNAIAGVLFSTTLANTLIIKNVTQPKYEVNYAV